MKPYAELRSRLIKRSAYIDSLVNLTESLVSSVIQEERQRIDPVSGMALRQLDMVLLAFSGSGALLQKDFETQPSCKAGTVLALDFSDRITGRSVGVSLAMRLLRQLTDTPVTDLVEWLSLRSPAAYLHLEKANVKRHQRPSRSKADADAGFFIFSAGERQCASAIKVASLDQLITGYTRRALSERQGSSLSRLHRTLSSSAAIFATVVHPLAVEIRSAKMDGQISRPMSWLPAVLEGGRGPSLLSHIVPSVWDVRWGDRWRDRPQSKALERQVFRFDQGGDFGVTFAPLWGGELPADLELSNVALENRRAVTSCLLTAYVEKLCNLALQQLA